MDASTRSQAAQPLQLETFRLQPGTTLIEASAGTGKTYTIQYIVLDLLFKGLEVSEILVVTFTELATQELRERLQRFLFEVDTALSSGEAVAQPLASVIERATLELGDEVVRRIVRRALLHSDEAAIYTIHGFCQRALQENAFAADVAFEAEICADTNRVVQGLVRDFLRQVNLQLNCPVPKRGDARGLRERAKKLAGFVRLAQPAAGGLAAMLEPLARAKQNLQSYESERDAILAEFRAHQGALSKSSYKDDFIHALSELVAQALTQPDGLQDAQFEKLGAAKITKAFSKKYEKEGKRVAHPFFYACDAYRAAQAALPERFFHCFDTWFVAAFNQYKVQQGIITYDDMILLLDRALRQRPALQQQLRARYRAALVDEFQDTDSRQYSIFDTVFSTETSADFDAPEATADPEASEATAAPRYFAMIGDPKQSIYGFRGADVDAYLAARARADCRYTLPINYRSERELIAATNAFFNGSNLGNARAGVSTEAQAIRFEAVSAPDSHGNKPRLVFSGTVALPRLYVREIDSAAEKADLLVSAAKLQMAGDIAELLQLSRSGHALIEWQGPNGPLRRPLRPSDIAVLVDRNKDAADVQQKLRRHDVLAVLNRAGDVFAGEEAQHFLHFLWACLDSREQFIHVLFVSPLYGLSAAELTALSDLERQSAHERFNRFGRAWKDGSSVGKLWLDFLYEIGARQRILKRTDGERVFTNYLHLGELARELERSEGLSPERLTDQIFDRVKTGGSGDASPDNPGLVRLESDADAIQILTLHSSKGLEFPVVFLPTLWQRSLKKISLEDLIAVPSSDDPDVLSALKVDSQWQQDRQCSEILRLGYVALTRAVHVCVYYNAPDMPRPTHASSNHKNGWFDLWLREQRAVEWPRPTAAAGAGFLSQLRREAPLDFVPQAPIPPLAPRSLGRRISDTYQITSYTSLTRRSHSSGADPSLPGGAEEVAPDVRLDFDLPVSAPADAGAGLPVAPLSLSLLPGGTQTGTCLHAILENCEFKIDPGQEQSVQQRWGQTALHYLNRHFPAGSESWLQARADEVTALLGRITQMQGPDGLSLAQLDHAHCLHEMEFYFPVESVDLAGLESVIAHWAQRQGLPYKVAPQHCPRIDGFLTGSIDLFFEHAGRYYVLDWKTNSPLSGQARDCSSYNREGMHAQMTHGRYYLQALIYSVAASAYLRDQLGQRFNWAQHMGGFVYCFVRGLSADTGWLQTTFSEEEVARAADALGQNSFKQQAGDLHG
ncbi:MAG: exodeoxyribonuclease V beta subunit [Lentimonas sp.]|jgi:exodeoxyribonuclease V beta subunit